VSDDDRSVSVLLAPLFTFSSAASLLSLLFRQGHAKFIATSAVSINSKNNFAKLPVRAGQAAELIMIVFNQGRARCAKQKQADEA
jgi:hypothetical protein